MSILISLVVSICVVGTPAQTSSSLLAKSLELIQKNEKSKALKLLERAFEKSQDPNELREIGVLILEASPSQYPKRNAYLRYLVKFNPEHPDSAKWYKELGDQALDGGRLSESEDWYLRALNHSDQKELVEYKLAFVKWNLKQPLEALRLFIKIFPTSELSLQSQIKKDIAKLWWEIGPLPVTDFEKIISLSDADFISTLFEWNPKGLSYGPKEEQLLFQLKESESTRANVLTFLQRNDIVFKKQPCFPFKNLLNPLDQISKELLLLCLKSPERPPTEKMLGFFETLKDLDEITLWAKAELLIECRKSDEALKLVFRPETFAERSQEFLNTIENLLREKGEAKFRSFYSEYRPTDFESFLLTYRSPHLLERLEQIDPDHWIPFEEKSLAGKNDKNFLLKKGAWLAKKPQLELEALKKVFDKLVAIPKVNESQLIGRAYQSLIDRATTKLPTVFSQKFNSEFKAWIKDLDKSLITLNSISDEWILISKPIFQIEVEKNVDALIAQLDASTLDPALSELSSTFTQKKEELKRDLQSKYFIEKRQKP